MQFQFLMMGGKREKRSVKILLCSTEMFGISTGFSYFHGIRVLFKNIVAVRMNSSLCISATFLYYFSKPHLQRFSKPLPQ